VLIDVARLVSKSSVCLTAHSAVKQTKDFLSLMSRRGLGGIGELQQELLCADLVEDLLDAAGQGRPHPLALRPPSPVVRRRHRARRGGETEEAAVAGVPLAHELADVVFAEARHLRRPGVARVPWSEWLPRPRRTSPGWPTSTGACWRRH